MARNKDVPYTIPWYISQPILVLAIIGVAFAPRPWVYLFSAVAVGIAFLTFGLHIRKAQWKVETGRFDE